MHTIHYGGPVDYERGFILHTNDYKKSQECKYLKNNLVLSSNSKILSDLTLGRGPSKFIVVIGYAMAKQPVIRGIKTKCMACC